MCRGELFHWVEKHGRFSENESWVIFRNLMQVVQHCHENGIVHRDLKPENILLATKSSSSLIKLADFGLATYIKPGHNLHGTVGSPFYIAPEVLAGGYNRAADVWSAGVILYVLLSGMPPFWGKTKSRIFDAVRAAGLQFPPDQWDQISTSAKDLITGMLCVDPSKRPSAAQVLDSAEPTQESYKHDNIDFELVEMGRGSFPILFISRVQDYSFSYESSVIGEGQEEQSPAFTSFSSLVVDSNTPCSATGGFSFRKCDESGATDFPSPIQSMLSFTFFSPNSAIEKREVAFGFNSIESNMGSVHGETPVNAESTLEKPFVLPCTSSVKREVGEIMQRLEFLRERMNGSWVSSIHSRRNHNIGLRELDQLNIIVTESIIRWASGTQIPSAPSLGLSLVS
ncbi:hypothetical protein P3X46_029960 [Hevea brasiliensis]|uniref:Protein kinase domain-containing protein n=1 Tax=Hevea brasiliensis TaxID=3981 RepID=A0ABQ9KVZ3_HEVBR|nr:hypothetical protein P3X46_029960 [Hevea brasiliensis]